MDRTDVLSLLSNKAALSTLRSLFVERASIFLNADVVLYGNRSHNDSEGGGQRGLMLQCTFKMKLETLVTERDELEWYMKRKQSWTWESEYGGVG